MKHPGAGRPLGPLTAESSASEETARRLSDVRPSSKPESVRRTWRARGVATLHARRLSQPASRAYRDVRSACQNLDYFGV
jgi:hypothetical protein